MSSIASQAVASKVMWADVTVHTSSQGQSHSPSNNCPSLGAKTNYLKMLSIKVNSLMYRHSADHINVDLNSFFPLYNNSKMFKHKSGGLVTFINQISISKVRGIKSNE